MTRLAEPFVALALLLAPALSWGAGVTVPAEAHCAYCGMHAARFPQSVMVIEYGGGTKSITCSLHCTALDFTRNKGKAATAIYVADYGDKGMTDAQKATWVIVPDKPGVMTTRAKWAFEKKGDAEAFVKRNGGALSTFQEALKAAEDDLVADDKRIQDRMAPKKPEPSPRP